MKLHECTAEKLKRISRKKKIICFGAGGNLSYVFETYKKLKLEERVAFVIDNNKSKIGTVICLNGHEVPVMAPDRLAEINMSQHVLVITALCYKEIFAQIQNICKNKKGMCYKAPDKRYDLTNRVERLMCRLPLKDVIVLNGEGDTCENAQALGKYIAENNYFGKYKLAWLCDHPERFSDTQNEVFLNRKTAMLADSFFDVIKYYHYVGRAKYIIYENRILRKLRDDQISVYLNHGSPPIKATKGIINLPSDLNYVISPSGYSTTIIKEQYSVNEQRIMECGSPRTDILFSEYGCERTEGLFKTERYDKIILWVPTFRQRKNTNRTDSDKKFNLGIPLLESVQDFERITCALEKMNVLMILKPHLLQDLTYIKINNKDSSHFSILTQDVLDEYGINIYDVMRLADGMITDYSTIGFDYMLLNRPIGYSTDDMHEYRLGFSVENPLELMPGEKMKNTDDMIKFIQNVCMNKDEFYEERNRVSRLVHDYPDGSNCKRLCEKIIL